ncbi:MAG: hypothetical protein FJ149_08235 [Euryarchaeota archaeon]|nr:hypothetical protein [Euryarchaeota archaeon]
MEDVTSGGRPFLPHPRVLHRVLDVIHSRPGFEIRWTKAQNLSGLNSERFRIYIDYCISRAYVSVRDLGHRHRIIRLEEPGRVWYETMSRYL